MPKRRLPPGPRGRFLTGNLFEFRQDMLGFLQRCARDYGDFVPLRFGPAQAILLNHPDLIEYVLLKDNHNFRKHLSLRMNRLLLGNGLLTSEGRFWLRQRRLTQPVFHRQRIAVYADTIVSYTQRLLDQWQHGETRDIHDDMTQLALEVVAKTLFDVELRHDVDTIGRVFEAALHRFDTRMWIPLPEWLPLPGNLRLRRAIRALDRLIYPMIEQRRTPDPNRHDLLSLLLQARDDDGRQMTERQVRDEATTLFLAGHETTALALTWTWYLLAHHPEVEQRLLTEVQTVLQGRTPTAADIPRLRFAEYVVLESMRVLPPVYGIGREAIRPCEIGGYPVRARTILFMSQWLMHRDGRYFDNPDLFHPERWADGLAERLPKYAYFPFSGGPRVCIGNTFAMMEAILVLAAIVPRFRVTLVENQRVEVWPSITLRPKEGIKVTVTKR